METRWQSDCWARQSLALAVKVMVLGWCCSLAVLAADVEVQQLVPAYPDEATPYPNAIKCFVCESDVGNYECNKKAYDQYCPEATNYCYTRHTFNSSSGQTVFVHKECATVTQCLDAVGCSQNGNSDIMDCVSCCDWTICNDFVPLNSTLAQLFETNGATSTITMPLTHTCNLLLLTSLITLFLTAR